MKSEDIVIRRKKKKNKNLEIFGGKKCNLGKVKKSREGQNPRLRHRRINHPFSKTLRFPTLRSSLLRFPSSIFYRFLHPLYLLTLLILIFTFFFLLIVSVYPSVCFISSFLKSPDPSAISMYSSSSFCFCTQIQMCYISTSRRTQAYHSTACWGQLSSKGTSFF